MNILQIKKLKKFTSLLLLLVFLLPTIVKLEHHPKHSVSNLKNEKHFPVLQENCPLCNFEFSIFISCIENIHLQNDDPSDCYFNNYSSLHYFNLSQFSFLLRAPPDRQI